ncbi:MAG: hypothetical protein J5646_06175 [Bacteroidales bacterium]|nr:hypothetical protein [Bacteroidales bacterium]
MKTCRHRISLVALCLMLLLPSCETASPEISITFESDYSQLVAAIENVNQTLADRMSLLEAALESGLADDETAIALVRKAVETLSGDLEKKLAAVSDAVRSQGTSLETKLALIEAAADAGFADAQARQALLQEALASLGGSLEERLTALEAVVKKQTTDFDTKLGLIEAAVKDGLADSVKAQKLLSEALDSLGGTLEEKLAAIDSALTSLTSGLETKLALIESAYSNGFSSETDAVKQLQTAVASLKGSVDGLDKDIDAVVTALGTLDSTIVSVDAMLSEIQKAVSGVSGYEDVLKSIMQTVEILSGKINGHAFVEMGDGLRWATCNVGAEHPWEKGDYFAWGETEPYYSSLSPMEWKEGKKDGYAWGSYFDNPSGDGITFTKYGGDLKLLLEPEDDAATVNWGGTWRTPSREEWKWIETHCTAKWTDNYGGTGVQGVIMKSTVAGYTDRSIFFPVTGCIDEQSIKFADQAFVWSTFVASGNQGHTAQMFSFFSDQGGGMGYGLTVRKRGVPIRAVSD